MIKDGFYNTDCLEGMKLIDDKSIDMILCDLPYGTTRCTWDIPLPFDVLWQQYERIIKDNGAIVLFSAQPFTTDLIQSNRKLFKYEIIWKKTLPTNFLNARKAPMRIHENICVFYKHQPTYNPIMTEVRRNDVGRIRKNGGAAQQYNEYRKKDWVYVETGQRYPTDVIEFSNWNGALFGNKENATKHPTQKPVPLCENLILTYTDEGDLVLDNCAGSCSTGIAAHRTGRRFIGFEKYKEIYEVGNTRLQQEKSQITLFDIGMERKR
ncbi:MAG: site-specific DNA-methyltransferase [Lachnospiraceae bacterium]|nr:site-specific DNA-methyltransferase [Lachnospiraceae bacterium]